mgnify:CR=1 FL=1
MNHDLRMWLLDGIDSAHEEYDGQTPDHVILPRSLKDDIRLEKLDADREFSVISEKHHGLIGMQVWFSDAVERRGNVALLLSDEAFLQIFPRTKDLYESNS